MHTSKKDYLSIYQLINANGHHNSENRVVMSSQHINQYIPIKDAEKPKCYSVYSNIFIKESDKMYKKTKGKTKLLASFNLFNKKYNLLEDIGNKQLLLIKMSPIVNEEGFTAKRNTNYTIGDTIEKNELIYYTDDTNKDLELCIGKNINTAIASYGDNFADAFVCSESFAKKFKHTETKEVEFVVNANELLINFYGNNNKYKPFPNIGEQVDPNSHILLAKRKINKNILPYFTNTYINNIHFTNDEIFYSEGTIKNIYVLKNVKDQTSFDRNKNLTIDYLDNIHNQLKQEHLRFYEFINNFIKNNSDYTVNSELKKMYQKIYNVYVVEKPVIYEDTEFNGYLVKFTIVKENIPIKVGSKISSFHASKGLISKIVKDEDMPIDENGKRIDLILNTNSIISRQNLGIIIEIIINNILEYIFENDNINKIHNLYIELNEILNKDTHILEDLKKLSKEDLISILQDMKENNDYYIVLEPYSENNTLENIIKFVNKYNINLYKQLTRNGKKLNGKVLSGNLYILKLKHEPNKKMSYASINQISSRTKQPTKSTIDFKKSKAINNHTSASIAEMEFIDLLTVRRDNNILKELLFLRSSDIVNRDIFARDLLYKDELQLSDYKDLKHNSSTLIKQVLMVLGVKL